MENAEFVNPTEYQDGRGFVLVAHELWRDHAGALKARNAEAYRQAFDELIALTRVWPGIQPPAAPVMPPT